MKQIVLDTNVLISGLLSPSNPPGQIVDAIRSNQLQLVIDDRIFLEYNLVIRRPKFAKWIQPEECGWILDFVYQESIRIAARSRINNLPDPKDACFLEVALEAKVPLVSGNLKHFPIKQCKGVKVLSPSDYFKRFKLEASES